MSHTILIVDDASDWRGTLAGLIQDVYPKFKVVTAASMEEARAQLAAYDFDLAIVDIRLDDSDEGNTDGLLLAEFIRAHYPQTQAMIITGYANLDTVRRAMHPDQAGLRLAVDYVEKDKIQIELLPRLAALLEKS